MAEFNLKLRKKEAIEENTSTLLEHYKRGEISKSDILELEQEAINDEEYEVAISIKEVLDYIASETAL
jgi:hypothetical protein